MRVGGWESGVGGGMCDGGVRVLPAPAGKTQRPILFDLRIKTNVGFFLP